MPQGDCQLKYHFYLGRVTVLSQKIIYILCIKLVYLLLVLINYPTANSIRPSTSGISISLSKKVEENTHIHFKVEILISTSDDFWKGLSKNYLQKPDRNEGGRSGG